MDELTRDLQESLAEGRVVLLVGSGVSVASVEVTAGEDNVASWPGLIHSGLRRAKDLGQLEERRAQLYAQLVDGMVPGDMIKAAETVTEALGGPGGGEYRRWLRETVGALTADRRELLDAVVGLGAPMMTTNYDDLLSEVSGLRALPWTEASEVERWLHGDQEGVFHLHGHWSRPESVVLGAGSYEDVLRDGPAQNLLRAIRTMKSLVFIGCGGTTGDPNLGKLLAWSGRNFAGSEYRHFRLCRAEEAETLRREHPPEQRIFPVVYGERYEELPGFLRGLQGQGETVLTRTTRSATPGSTSIASPVANFDRWTPDWFQRQFKRAVTTLDRRYIAALLGEQVHVTLQVEEMLDAVARGPSLQKHWETRLEELADAARRPYALDALAETEVLRGLFSEALFLARDLGQIRVDGVEALDLAPIRERVRGLQRRLHVNIDRARMASTESDVDGKRDPGTGESPSGRRRDAVYRLHILSGELHRLLEFLDSTAMIAAREGVLLLTGSAGSGKSHLLAHFTETRLKEGAPSLLIIGETVRGDGPASVDLMRQLSEGAGQPTLGELNCVAERLGVMGVVAIDALNETYDERYWSSFLPALVADFQALKHLALVISVRSEYVDAVLPESVRERILTVEHPGFRELSPDQLGPVLETYGLPAARQVILSPELYNPLIMHLVCRGLQEGGYTGLEDLPRGVAALFGFVVAELNQRLARPECMNFDAQAPVVHRALQTIAEEMWQRDTPHVPMHELRLRVQPLLYPYAFSPSPKDLLRELVREGLLREVVPWDIPEEEREGRYLSFQFQHLEDLYRAEALLQGGSASSEPRRILRDALDRIGEDGELRWTHRGVLRMLAALAGERWGIELLELVEKQDLADAIRVAWRESLVVRTTASVTEETVLAFEGWLDSGTAGWSEIVDILGALALRLDHPLNAEYLDRFLRRLDMPARDVGWSEVVFWSLGEDGHPLTTLRLWARRLPLGAPLSDEQSWLATLALAWTFTTSQRIVRDRATKALVRVLELSPALAARVVGHFADVDDPYVPERVLAAAYGAMTRAKDDGALAAVCEVVLSKFFAANSPPQDSLLRDYALSILEFAHHRGALPDGMSMEAVRPPYAIVPWPADLPEERELEERLAADQTEFGFSSRLLASMSEMGDFWIYVVGNPPWMGVPRGGASKAGGSPRISKDLVRRFLLNRILDLGWDEARMGWVDRHRGSAWERSPNADERLGKKYQWIAYHQLLATLQDAFEPAEDCHGEFAQDGFYRRHQLDPTCLIAETGGREHPNGVERCWWMPNAYEERIADTPYSDWESQAPGLPVLDQLLEVADPHGQRWLILNIFREWAEPRSLGYNFDEMLTRRYSLLIHSLVVRTEEADAIAEWFGAQYLFGRWAPENEDGCFRLREAFWHPVERRREACGVHAWQSIRGTPEPWRAIPAGAGLLVEGQSDDYSVDETYDISLPAPWLVDFLNLEHGQFDGTWVDAAGETLFWDPSISEEGHSALLMRRDVLSRLEQEGYTLVWLGLGELLGWRDGESRYVSATSASARLGPEGWACWQHQHPWGDRGPR
ncbi:MAG: SIR2 family protein [Polyangiaceae bacterium]|nr:SIR2 family protein [Polyangiaceae bacterium]